MKYVIALLGVSLIIFQPTPAPEKPLLSELYQEGEVHLLAPGVISTTAGEYSPTFDVERNELYFMRRTPREFDYTIYSSRLDQNGWSTPAIVSFSGQYRDAGPYLSPDGNTLFFDSRRPSPQVPSSSINLWYSERTNGKWSEAQFLYHTSKNTDAEQDEYGPAVDGDGNLYFYSFRSPYRGGARYISFPDKYEEIALETTLPDPSARTFISYLYITPDGNTAIMEGRAQYRNDTDLYCSYKKQNGDWSTPQEISMVNTKADEGGPYLTADGEYLLFTSNRPTNQASTKNANLFIVAAKNILESCKE